MKSHIQNVKTPESDYPRLVCAKLNENLIGLLLNDSKVVVLQNGGSSYKNGDEITIPSFIASCKPFHGELVLSND